MKKRFSSAERRARKVADTARYLKQIGRKAQKREEPNDRRFDRKLHVELGRMSPIEFSDLIHGDE